MFSNSTHFPCHNNFWGFKFIRFGYSHIFYVYIFSFEYLNRKNNFYVLKIRYFILRLMKLMRNELYNFLLLCKIQ
jgi:hypothetical protein